MTDDGYVPVDSATLRTGFPGVYAVGDVTTAGVPEAGVFAEGAARVVAPSLIGELHDGERPGPYAGRGSCHIEFGHGRVGVWTSTSRRAHADRDLQRAVRRPGRREGALRLQPPGALVRQLTRGARSNLAPSRAGGQADDGVRHRARGSMNRRARSARRLAAARDEDRKLRPSPSTVPLPHGSERLGPVPETPAPDDKEPPRTAGSLLLPARWNNEPPVRRERAAPLGHDGRRKLFCTLDGRTLEQP
jgi:hypothetical protein